MKSVLSLSLLLLGVVWGQLEGDIFAEQQQQNEICVDPLHTTTKIHKKVYKVGVLADRGFEAAYDEFNVTFSEYLTATAGMKFDPPVEFELKPLDFISLFDDVENQEIDFVYANPSAYSCIASEYGANSLASQISKRIVDGKEYDLTKFGGVIFTRADNDEIQIVKDIKGHSIACTSISSLGSGQMQFRLLLHAGLSYLNCPAQVAFTSNQETIVNGVINGDFEVGFVRTDQIERTRDANGNLVDRSLLKILEPQEGLEIDGEPFPFESSTPLYPEWNVASLNWVPDDISQEVQIALLALQDHAEAEGRCDSTPELMVIAKTARSNGKYTGWRSTLSYFELRNMQEETGFIKMDPDTHISRCQRSSEIMDAIVCPAGKILKTEEEVMNGCTEKEIPCADGYQCLCTPCRKAFDVDVYPVFSEFEQKAVDCPYNLDNGCPKFAVCGGVTQGQQGTYRMEDNKKRENVTFTANILEGEVRIPISVAHVSDFEYEFQFDATDQLTGLVILEVLVDGDQIPESPFRLQVEPPECDGAHREPNDLGQCVCSSSSVEIGANCVLLAVLIPSIIVPIVLIAFVCFYFYMQHQKKLADSIWSVQPEELQFDDPPMILGRGTFGLVLLAEYRGTQVAVKRVIPKKEVSSGKKGKELPGTASSSMSSVFHASADLESGYASGVATSTTTASRPPPPQRRRSSLKETLSKFNFDMDDTTSEKPSAPAPPVRMSRRASWTFGDVDAAQLSNLSGSGSHHMAPCMRSSDTGMSSGSTWAMGSATSVKGSWSLKKKKGVDDHNRLKEDFLVEMRHLSKLRHPCITTVMGAVIGKNAEPMLVMEYMELGSLHDLLHNESMIMDGDIVLPILRDIARGMRFLHSAEPKVIHGDLKTQNVLVDSKYRAKVADFGLSQKKTMGACGTPLWMAPELLRGDSENSAASDIYSFGIILYEVYSRKDPYYGENHKEVLKQVVDLNINKRPIMPQSCPKVITHLMRDCVLADPHARPCSQEVDMRLKRLDADIVEPGQTVQSMQRKKQAQRNSRNEDLLYQVFPKHIAAALRDGQKVEAESFDCATCFFSDIVGYTTISSKLDPMKVSDMLDRLYEKFDALSEEHDIFKVDTIGDAYMAVTNVHKDQPDHAARIARFCIDAIAASNETLIDVDDPGKGSVQIRCGFHSGPIVTDVVGTRSPKYTLFGDTVNTSSRMESTCQTGKIQCSDTSAALVKAQDPTVKVVPRGMITVKGKGEMETFWIRE